MTKIDKAFEILASRRRALGIAGGAAVSAAAIAGAHKVLSQPAATPASARTTPPSPGQAATFGPIPYGASVSSDDLPKDLDYQRALIRYCQQVVPEYGLKWSSIRPASGKFDWGPADSVIDFAKANRLGVRGHTLVWYEAMPDWAKRISSAAEAERELVTHIETVVGRYRGIIKSWDVVNEPLGEKATNASQLRQSVWSSLLGERYLEIAFCTAARVDPDCQLVLNEYGIETTIPQDRGKRQAFRDLIRRLKDKGVPIHGIGIQSHINADRTIDTEGLAWLVGEITSMRMATLITELDMIDNKLPGPVEIRDALTAAKTYELLDTITRVTRPSAIITWGITDKRTWVPMWNKRDDGRPNRPLPFDADYRPKPMWNVIEYFSRGRA